MRCMGGGPDQLFRATMEESEQEVWSWGAGTEGQLGTEKLQDEHTPQLLRSFPSQVGPISFLSCGGAHVIALTPAGRVVTWGRGTSGQLGHGEMVNSVRPRVVLALEGCVITCVSAGWNHSGFVSDTGWVFTCGDGSFGQLGLGDYNSRCSPERVAYFDSRQVEQIACGMRHSIVLVKDQLGGQVLGFGSGKRGQLGISNEKVKTLSLPDAVVRLDNVKILSVYANGDHSAALCAKGRLYIWGRGFSGAADIHIPWCVTPHLFGHTALGWNHALLLTVDGKVFTIGCYGHGILSGPQLTQAEQKPDKDDNVRSIHGLTGKEVLQIAAGAEHSALVTDDGSVMTWGWGEHGQLGFGDTTNRTSPHEVSFNRPLTKQLLVPRVFCGSGFTYVIRTPGSDSKN